jgi:GDPmannose 4,6-dehydratase
MKIEKFWKNKNILITGISGFVGSNLAKNLALNGANIVGITQKKRKQNSLLYYEKINKKVLPSLCKWYEEYFGHNR